MQVPVNKGSDFVSYLVTSGHLDASGAQRARNATASAAQSVDVVLLELGLIPEQELAVAQAKYLGTRVAEPHHYPESPILEDLLPTPFLRSNYLLPLSIDGDRLVIAAAHPLKSEPIEALAYFLDRPVEAWVAPRTDWENAFRRIYDGVVVQADTLNDAGTLNTVEESDAERLKDFAREAPVIRFVNRLINDAVERGASDIHLEPLVDRVQIRLRIDGLLTTCQSIDKALHAGVASRIKILARLNIVERRLPQDGRISLAVKGREIDFRVSTVPTLNGESVVLRILNRQELKLDFPSLGFDAGSTATIARIIHQPNGMVLVAGPTGSGKTTTLYASICDLRQMQRKILTIEDPVEYHLDGVVQTQVKPQIGLDFATGLRAFLRQDPDIIMVGEIRDGETARTAVQASLTGHLVLSTVHTNGAAATVTRLLDMGVEDYLLVSTLRAVIAQRLVRRLCQKCKRVRRDTAAMLARLGACPETFPGHLHEPVGCSTCHGEGYRGRTTIYEVMTMSRPLQEMVLSGGGDSKIEKAAREQGMKTLLETGLAKSMAGETSFEEVLRATSAC
jgi:general secretion pathway protein E